jgi:hypothetical protein
MAIEALATYFPSSTINVADSDPTEASQAETSGVLQSLISVLDLPDSPLRRHSVKMLEHVFSPDGENLPVL